MSNDRIRERPRLTVSPRWNLFGFTPYLSGELYHEEELDSWVRQRVYVGVTRPLTKTMSLDVFYCRERNKGATGWDQTNNILATVLKFGF